MKDSESENSSQDDSRKEFSVTPAEASRLLGIRPYALRAHTSHLRYWDKGPRLKLPKPEGER